MSARGGAERTGKRGGPERGLACGPGSDRWRGHQEQETWNLEPGPLGRRGVEPIQSLRTRRGRGVWAQPPKQPLSVSSGTHVTFQISALTRRGKRAGSTRKAPAPRGGGCEPAEWVAGQGHVDPAAPWGGREDRRGSAQAAGEATLSREPPQGPRWLSPQHVSAPHPTPTPTAPHPHPHSSSS